MKLVFPLINYQAVTLVCFSKVSIQIAEVVYSLNVSMKMETLKSRHRDSFD